MRTERGQASVEMLGFVPAVLIVALVVMQMLSIGYAAVLAGNAAEAGALALAAGADPHAGVREALPGWSRARARVSVDDGRVEVRIRPPALLRPLADKIEVGADAAVEEP